MKKKEFKLEEVFQCGIAKLKVVPERRCVGCFFEHICDSLEINMQKLDIIKGNCYGCFREDETSVIFVEVEE